MRIQSILFVIYIMRLQCNKAMSTKQQTKPKPLGIPKEILCLLSAAQAAKTQAEYKSAIQGLKDADIGCNDAQLSTLVFLVAFSRVLFSSELKANSAHCMFTYMKASMVGSQATGQPLPLFIKFALPNPLADSPLNDTVNGYMLTWLKQRKPHLRCLMTYVDCFTTYVTPISQKALAKLKSSWVPADMFEARQPKAVCGPAKTPGSSDMVMCSAFVAVKGKALSTTIKDQRHPIASILKTLPEFLGAIAYMGTNLGFAHNDSHFSNILYGVEGTDKTDKTDKTNNGKGSKRLLLIDYGRVTFDKELLQSYGALQTFLDRIPIDVTKLCIPNPPRRDLTKMTFEGFMAYAADGNIAAANARREIEYDYTDEHEYDDDYDPKSTAPAKMLVAKHLYLCDLACMGGNFANMQHQMADPVQAPDVVRMSNLFPDLLSFENYGQKKGHTETWFVKKALCYEGRSIARRYWNVEMPAWERALLCCAFAAWLLYTVQSKNVTEVDMAKLEDKDLFWRGGMQIKCDKGFYVRLEKVLQENVGMVKTIDEWLLEQFEAGGAGSANGITVTASATVAGGMAACAAKGLPQMFDGKDAAFDAYIQKNYPVEVAEDGTSESGPRGPRSKRSKSQSKSKRT